VVSSRALATLFVVRTRRIRRCMRAYLSNIFTCICMPSRNIAVQRSVYDALTREKRGGESFTSVLRRLLEAREGLEEIVGSWGKTGARSDRVTLRTLRAEGRRAK